jgi:hypothetical protein
VAEKSAEVDTLAAEAARALGCENGLETAEAVLRAGLLRLGGAMLGEALSADPGHRGPRADCGHGHEAVFAGYREKVIDTVLGPVALRRAWYHCAECGPGLAPRDDELGVAGTSMSPGLAAMNDLAAAAGPFAGAARLLEKLAGVRLTARRVERAAEASGTALAAAGRERARLIASRKVVPLPPSPLPDKLYAAIDGTGVPMTAKETAGRRGKARTAAPAPARSSSPSSSPRTSSTLTATPSATGPPRASSRLSSPRRSGTWSGPRASAAARTTSASSPSSATAPPGTSPPRSSPRPPRSSTSTTPASTCTRSPGPWSSCPATEGTNGSPPASKTSTTAASTASRPPSANTPVEGIKKDEVGKELGYFLNNAPACATAGSAHAACSSDPASSRPAARPSLLGKDSSRQACTGPSQEPTPSSPCAAKRPAASGKPSATTVTTRQEPPDLPLPEDDYLGAGPLLPAAIS